MSFMLQRLSHLYSSYSHSCSSSSLNRLWAPLGESSLFTEIQQKFHFIYTFHKCQCHPNYSHHDNKLSSRLYNIPILEENLPNMEVPDSDSSQHPRITQDSRGKGAMFWTYYGNRDRWECQQAIHYTCRENWELGLSQ